MRGRRGRGGDHRGRGGSDAAGSQAVKVGRELEKQRTDYPREPREGALPCPHPDLGVLALRTVKEQVSAVSSCLVGEGSFRQT